MKAYGGAEVTLRSVQKHCHINSKSFVFKSEACRSKREGLCLWEFDDNNIGSVMEWPKKTLIPLHKTAHTGSK